MIHRSDHQKTDEKEVDVDKNLAFAKSDLPFAPGCLFKPRTIGKICNSNGRVFLFGGYVSLHLVLSGTGDVSWRDQNRKLKPGDMFSILPEVEVRYTNTPDAPWSFCWIDIMGPAAEQIADEAGFNVSNPVLAGFPYKEQLKSKFELIFSRAESNENDPCVFAGLIQDLLSLLRKPVANPCCRSVADDFEKLLQDPRNFAMNVNEFSAALNIDRTTLFHACKKFKTMSPVRMLIRQKIEYCGKLLLDYPELPLNQIAAMSGFADERYMCRAFKRETSCTPAGYRKEMSDSRLSRKVEIRSGKMKSEEGQRNS